MSATSAPYGFMPVRRMDGGQVNAAPYKIAAAYATAIFKNQCVKLVTAGTVEAAAANEDILGVLVGVEYTDSIGRRVVDTKWPTGGVASATDITAWVIDDPQTLYSVQADGSVAETARGDQADISNASANANGLSTSTLSATLKGAGIQGQFRVIDLDRYVDNAWGDTYTRVLVQVARHQFVSNKTAI